MLLDKLASKTIWSTTIHEQHPRRHPRNLYRQNRQWWTSDMEFQSMLVFMTGEEISSNTAD
jgi:hypothetical protein